MNLANDIFHRADPAEPALIEATRTTSYGDLDAWTAAAAAALGDCRGRRVGLSCPNGLAHIVWSLALLRAGAVLIPVAPELTGPEQVELAATTSLHAVLAADGHDWPHPARETRALAAAGLSATWFELAPPPPTFDETELARLNPALVRFSSGTTGRRKGIVLSHETLLARLTAANAGLGIGPGDRILWMLPMAHHFAVSLLLYLRHGAATVLPASHLGEDVVAALRAHRGTVLYAAPFHHALLAGAPGAGPVPSLRLAVSTAAPLPAATAEAFQQTFGLPLRQALGIIECGLPLLNTAWPKKTGSVGAPQPDFELELRDESGRPVAEGETGELCLRGPGFADAYLSPWTPRERLLEDGWFRTGDLARRDGDGAIWLLGRRHSVINVGGMKCFPEEIEACLQTHPGVYEARVAGLPHPGFGQVPAAEIVARDPVAPPSVRALAEHCRARLSAHKVPVRFVLVPALPKTASGKPDRTRPLAETAVAPWAATG